MTKVYVLPGVWWIDIPDAGWRILCGSPMDAVKHLMTRGLVKGVEKNGVAYETGPNAILLSDQPIQKGRFWNLAEFPVLHMLYRQGMAIPGHPGNDGRRPCVIGLPARTEAVLQYIHRGTYGLSTREELAEAGFEGKELDELWNLKLKFSGGVPKSPKELVDTVPVVNGKAKLDGGVTIRRDGHNRYTISRGNEKTEVDLNLPSDEDWRPTYSLNDREIDEGYFSITHIGEGNGWDPEKPCMGSLISYRGRRYLIDSGPGVGFSVEALGLDVADIEGVFLTHAHDDHFAGLTSLVRVDRRISLYATKPVYETVRKKVAAVMEADDSFLDRMVKVRILERDRWNDVDGLEVKPVNSPHPVETTIFWFRSLWEGGYRSYAHLADIVSRPVLDGFVGEGGISPEYRDRVWEEYHRYADVKKIDAGRGLIHGLAEDFVDDPSPRLVLSHYEGYLSNAEKEIGANATFGQSEILIPARGDRIRDAAARYLNGAMPELKRHDALTLLNGKIYTYPPGTPLIKKGQIPDAILLVISGSAEYIASDSQPVSRFTAGSLIGETEILEGTKSGGSYRTRGYFKALRMPDDLYIHALKRADLKERRSLLAVKRRFLRATAFPGYVVSSPRIDHLVNAMEIRPWKSGTSIVGGDDLLYALSAGRAVIEGPEDGRELSIGEPFNISAVIPSKETASPSTWTSLEEGKIAVIPGETVREVPVLAWTLDEMTAWDG